jgi:hypothetical protein
MKRYNFFILLVIFSLNIIYPAFLLGDTYSDQQSSNVSFRLLGGLNLAKTRYHWGDPIMAAEVALMEPYHEYRIGVCAGFGLETRGRLGVIVELLYHLKGDKIDFDDGVDLQKSTIAIHEMSLPVLLKLNLSRNTGPYLMAGGEIGFVLTAIERHEIYTDLGDDEPEVHYSKGSENITEKLKRLNYGMVLGAGFKFRTTGLLFFTEVRYHYGLADLSKDEIKAHPNDKMKTDAIVFAIGISTL